MTGIHTLFVEWTKAKKKRKREMSDVLLERMAKIRRERVTVGQSELNVYPSRHCENVKVSQLRPIQGSVFTHITHITG